MKKVMSLLLAVMVVLSMSACGGNETTIDNDTGVSTTQNQTDVTDTSSTEQSTDTSSSDIDNNGNTDDTDVPSSTASKPNTAEPDTSKPTTTKPETSKPTTTTKPETTKPSTPTHTHSYSNATCTEPAKCSCGATKGSKLGHKWQDATCKEPKTCSVCKMTEGNKAEHIVDGIVCKFCKQAVPVNSTNIKKREYTIYKFSNIPNEILTFSVDIENGSGNYCNYLPCEKQNGMCPESEDHFNYKNKDYHIFGGSGLGPVTVRNSNNHIIINIEHYNATLIVEVLSNDTLRVVSISGQLPRELHVGDVFE